MGQSADELKHEIEGTRAELSDTLDAIGDRVSPGRVLARRKNRMVGGLQSVKDRVMGPLAAAKDGATDGAGSVVDTIGSTPDAIRHQAQGSPLAAGAIAFGVGFLVAAVFPPSAAEQHAAEELMDRAEPLKDDVVAAGRELAGVAKDAAKEAADEVRTSASAGKDAVADTVRTGVESATATAGDAVESVKAQTTTPSA